MHNLALLFRALADETRLQILALILKYGELCVCDFEHVLGITQSKASRHLRYLHNSGFLHDRREAVWTYYRIAENLDPEHQILLESVRKLVDNRKLADVEQKISAWLKHKGCTAANARVSHRANNNKGADK
jgi:ArsR family transcriptional regulator